MRRPKRFSPAWVVLLVIGAVLAPVIFTTQADPDLWGNVRFGLDVLTTHAVAPADPYSFTQDKAWINHEWLSELLMGGAYRAGGSLGLSLLKATLVGLIVFLALRPYLEISPPILAIALLIIVVGSGRVTSTLRPQLWSLLLVVILCRMLIAGRRRWWLAAIPLMFALWVNFHGGWIVGAAVLAIWAATTFWREPASRGFLLVLAPLTLVSTLLNPYGWRMWVFLGETVRMSRPIVEWEPLWTTPFTAWLPWLAVAIATFLSMFAKQPPSIDRLVTLAFLGVASSRVERLTSFFVVGAVILLSPTVRAQWPSRVRPLPALSRRAAVIFGTVCAAIVLTSAAISARAASCLRLDGNWIPDRIVGQSLVDGRVAGRLVTWFDWGHYAIWHLSPAIRVSLDGRRETIYSDAVLKHHDELDAATPQGLAYLQSLNPDYVWLPAALTKLQEWLPAHGYRIDIKTDRSFVAVRDDRPVLKLSTSPLASCFPGP